MYSTATLQTTTAVQVIYAAHIFVPDCTLILLYIFSIPVYRFCHANRLTIQARFNLSRHRAAAQQGKASSMGERG